MSTPHNPVETRVAVLVDCDNTTPEILDYALRVVAQFGRVVLRRGYGNHTTLTRNWQEALVRQAFTPCLQFPVRCRQRTLPTSPWRSTPWRPCSTTGQTSSASSPATPILPTCAASSANRGATVCIVGEAKTPDALRKRQRPVSSNGRPRHPSRRPKNRSRQRQTRSRQSRSAQARNPQTPPPIRRRGSRTTRRQHIGRPRRPGPARPIPQTHRPGVFHRPPTAIRGCWTW